MDRRAFVSSVTLGLLAALLAAAAQTAGKVYRVGYLSPIPVAERGSNPSFNIFRREMRQRGYVEGQNFVLEHRFVEGSPGRDSEVVG
jgi:putative ABC transport system substrate-binding protein